ncbi:MAG: type VI secretion system baseplate subunit TssE [Gammaproteobacteria bacterium]
MAELSLKERLQPSLLDRLTDSDPDRKEESREHRVLSVKQLKQSVLRDLSWLFNTTALAEVEDLKGYPHAVDSVINYGIPALSGVNLSNINIQKLQRQIKQAIMDFEPRIMAKTLKIEVIADEHEMSNTAICFKIEGDLWAQPLPVRLYIRSDIDLETGEVNIKDLGG